MFAYVKASTSRVIAYGSIIVSYDYNRLNLIENGV